MKKLKQLLLFSFIILGASLGHAQQSLSGSVVDGAGPLPGVTIIEKGTNNGDSIDMGVDALTNGVGTTANGVSSGMGVGALIGDAPYSTANAISSNMSVLAKGTDPADIPS